MKNKLLIALRIAVTLGILLALFKFVRYKELIEVYRHSDKLYILFAVICFVVSLFLCMLRWKLLLFSLGVGVSFKEVICASASSLFFNLFFFSYIAGDVFRGVSISYRHGDPKKVASSVLMDRYIGMLALVLIALAAFLLSFFKSVNLNHKTVIIALFILCSIVGIGSLIIFSKTFFSLLLKVLKKGSKLKTRVVSFHDQLYFFKKRPDVLLKGMALSLAVHLLTVYAFFITSKAFAVNVSLYFFLVLVPIITAIASIPITISGAGTREAASIFYFSLINIEASIALGISLLNGAFMILSQILGGVVYISLYHKRLQPPKKNEIQND
jgi:uncharacterized protein (TIRG00374 family)